MPCPYSHCMLPSPAQGLYFWVLIFGRRSVTDAFLLTDTMRTVFIEENFGAFRSAFSISIMRSRCCLSVALSMC